MQIGRSWPHVPSSLLAPWSPTRYPSSCAASTRIPMVAHPTRLLKHQRMSRSKLGSICAAALLLVALAPPAWPELPSCRMAPSAARGTEIDESELAGCGCERHAHRGATDGYRVAEQTTRGPAPCCRLAPLAVLLPLPAGALAGSVARAVELGRVSAGPDALSAPASADATATRAAAAWRPLFKLHASLLI